LPLRVVSGLLGSFGLGAFLAFVPVVFFLELLDTAGGVDIFHLAGEKRMAYGADFNVDIFPCAARDKFVAATAGHRGFLVFWMNAGFHALSPERLSHDSYTNHCS